MKSTVVFLLFSIVLLSPVLVQARNIAPQTDGPRLTCRAALLMDLHSGQVLWEKNGYVRRAPASTTKIVTAYMGIMEAKPHQVIKVSQKAAWTEGSRLHIVAGSKYYLKDLLTGLMMRSGNDAAVAIAEGLAGDVPHFAHRMNVLVQRLGAFNSHFENPNGLPAKGHYSSAMDLATITHIALQDARFRAIVSQKSAQVHSLDGRIRMVNNTNRLLWTYPGAIGVKTGTTRAAGRCLVSAAERQGFGLVAVVLKAADRWGDSERLLDYGYSHFQAIQRLQAGEIVAHVPVNLGPQKSVEAVVEHALYHVVPKNAQQIRVQINLPAQLLAPVHKGDRIGSATLMVDGLAVARTPILANNSAIKRSWWQRFFKI